MNAGRLKFFKAIRKVLLGLKTHLEVPLGYQGKTVRDGGFHIGRLPPGVKSD